VQGKFNVIFII